MLVVAIFLAGLFALRLRGYHLSRMNGLRIRWPLLAVSALIIQVFIISLWPDGWHVGHLVVHLGTYVLLTLFLWANRGVPWLWVSTLGVGCNAAVIAANGGVSC